MKSTAQAGQSVSSRRKKRPISSGRCIARALAASLLAAAAGAATAATPADQGISIQAPWMRLIIKSRPAAGYFALHNDTGSALTLTGASSPGCGTLMLHQTKSVNGVDKMLPVKSIAVPAHGVVTFAPGGYHLMCMSPTGSLSIGHEIPVTLKFAGGKTATAQFAVRGPNGTTATGKMSMDGMHKGK